MGESDSPQPRWPDSEPCISFTDLAATGWDLEWEDGLMVKLSYTFKSA